MTKQDLSQIREIVKEEVRAETSPLNQKIDQFHREMIERFDRFQLMESGDIEPLYKGIKDHDKRIFKLETIVLK